MITIAVDNRVRIPTEDLPEEIAEKIRAEFTHKNPELAAKKALGLPTWNIPPEIKSYDERTDGELSIPRGGTSRVREILRAAKVDFRISDRRHPGDPCIDFPSYVGHSLRWYQGEAIEAAMRVQNCILRAPTGSGKTTMAIALAARMAVNTLIIVSTSGLFKQWEERATKELGIRREDVGVIQGKRRRLRPLTIAMQKTLSAKGIDQELREFFGAIICDEVQLFAASTFYAVTDPFPAKYRIGVSADERRKDRKEFLTYDIFGDVAHEVSRKQLEDEGAIVDVEIRVVPSDFEAEWYGLADAEDEDDERKIDFKRLLDEMTNNEARNQLVMRHAMAEIDKGERVIMLSHRIDHCTALDRNFVAAQIPSGYLIGNNEEEFERTRAGILDGSIRAGTGTYQALGYGIDLPAVGAGIATTPIASNRQAFNQVRGRLGRPAPGKKQGRLYYLWDQHVYPKHLRNIVAWNPTVKIFIGGKWIEARAYLKRKRRR